MKKSKQKFKLWALLLIAIKVICAMIFIYVPLQFELKNFCAKVFLFFHKKQLVEEQFIERSFLQFKDFLLPHNCIILKGTIFLVVFEILSVNKSSVPVIAGQGVADKSFCV